MLEFGQLAKDCRGKCRCGSDVAQITCTACEGTGCDDCQGGFVDLEGCPRLVPGREFIECQHFAGLYEKGLPPIAGGALDQASWFTDWCRFYWSEQSHWKAKLGILS